MKVILILLRLGRDGLFSLALSRVKFTSPRLKSIHQLESELVDELALYIIWITW